MSPAGMTGDRPASSVGQTFVIRRRPRSLAFLIEKEGEQIGRVLQLEPDVTDIGRDPRNHVVVSDVLVSGFHARVERGPDGGFVITDRGSTNGSRVNGEPLNTPRAIDENDEVGIGNTTLVLKVVT
jgi:pSer/pThr/pTyr-binding forkhead associated (FHA) protein